MKKLIFFGYNLHEEVDSTTTWHELSTSIHKQKLLHICKTLEFLFITKDEIDETKIYRVMHAYLSLLSWSMPHFSVERKRERKREKKKRFKIVVASAYASSVSCC